MLTVGYQDLTKSLHNRKPKVYCAYLAHWAQVGVKIPLPPAAPTVANTQAQEKQISKRYMLGKGLMDGKSSKLGISPKTSGLRLDGTEISAAPKCFAYCKYSKGICWMQLLTDSGTLGYYANYQRNGMYRYARFKWPQIARMERNRLEPVFWGLNSTLNNYRNNSGGNGGIKWSTTHPPASNNWQPSPGREDWLSSSGEREIRSSQLEKPRGLM